MKNLLLINHSDTRGGASVVTLRLLKALVAAGVDARMLVVHKDTDNLRVGTPAVAPWRVRAAFLGECARDFAGDGFNRANLFKVSSGTCGLPLHRHPWVAGADVVVLNWINQGMLSLDGIGRIAAMGKRMAWTLHDMWPLTGVCHHAGTCTRYATGCGHCPLVSGGKKEHDFSTRVFARKKRLYEQHPMQMIAVSSWVARKCAESALTASLPVAVIPNAFPVEEYAITPTLGRGELGLPAGNLIVMGAARLDDPIKNLPLAVDTLNRLADSGCEATAVFFGDIRDAHALDSLRLPHVHLGPVSSPERLAQVYAHASVVLSTSRYETLPGTIIEGMAAGAVPVATSNGGQRDIIDHGVDGYIADSDDADILARHIAAALANPFDRMAQHKAVERRFAARNVARKYIDLLGLDQ